MDPIAILQRRIEQLESKLGLCPSIHEDESRHEIPNVVDQLNQANNFITSAMSGHEKLTEAAKRATELNNYADPNFVQNLQHSDMKSQEIVDSEPIIRHHCQCMHRCKKAAPALESEAVQQVPAMQDTLDKMLSQAAHLKDQSDMVSGGVQQVAETCGHAANHASHQLTKLAENVDKLESKAVRRRRNGLD